jgi:hypothetical protein
VTPEDHDVAVRTSTRSDKYAIDFDVEPRETHFFAPFVPLSAGGVGAEGPVSDPALYPR